MPPAAEKIAEWEAIAERRAKAVVAGKWFALFGAVVIVVALGYCAGRNGGTIPSKEQRSLDALEFTMPAYQAQRAALVVHETTYVAQSKREATHATATLHAADSIKEQADTLATSSDAQDTTSVWFTIAQLRELESDSLRAMIRWQASALLHQTLARQAADSEVTLADARADALDNLNHRLARDIVKGDCRIAWVLACPSRKTTAVVAVVGTYLLTRPSVRAAIAKVIP